MSLPSNDINDLNRNKIIESTSTPGQPGSVVLNPDGSDILKGASVTAHGGNNALVVHTPGLDAVGNLTALNSTVELDDMDGSGTVIMVVSGTWTGKIVFEGSIDSVWVNLSVVQPLGGITPNGIQNDNQNGSYRVLLPSGYTKLRARMSQYTSGTATVQFHSSIVSGSAYVWQLNPANLQVTTTPASGTTTIVSNRYSVNDIDDYTTTSKTYIGKEDSTGNWYILRIDESGNYPVLRYATINNNPTMTTYGLAFANRVTLTYDTTATAF